jgi:hypothetical protein
MAANAVSGFRPSTSGFHFTNIFPSLPLPIHIPLLGTLRLGDAAGGLCGGMVFACLDCFNSGYPIPDTTSAPSSENDPLFRYLSQRLYDSLDVPAGVVKYYEWMSRPDNDHLIVKGVHSLTLDEGWPDVQAALDGGTPAALGLITTHSLNPVNLSKNHQVLAYRYELDTDTGDLHISVYDPNCPNQDDLVLSLNVNQPGPIAYSTGETVRGFFQTAYKPADIAAALGASA